MKKDLNEIEVVETVVEVLTNRHQCRSVKNKSSNLRLNNEGTRPTSN